MPQYINKNDVIAEIEKRMQELRPTNTHQMQVGEKMDRDVLMWINALTWVKKVIDSLEVKDPYEQIVQYDSIKAGIQAHAETYSFNIESKLFNQLTKEQQKLWREEIEQACISGGEAGVELERDPRYKENLEVKEVDLENEIKCFTMSKELYEADSPIKAVAEHFYALGINAAQKGE